MENDIPLDQLVPTKSQYLTKEDAGENGINVTIKGFTIEEVGSGRDAENCCICHFEEDLKPMVINKTNMNRIKHITKAETTGEASGQSVNLYNDPMVEFGGKLVGGIRVRQAQKIEISQVPKSNTIDDFNDDVPF